MVNLSKFRPQITKYNFYDKISCLLSCEFGCNSYIYEYVIKLWREVQTLLFWVDGFRFDLTKYWCKKTIMCQYVRRALSPLSFAWMWPFVTILYFDSLNSFTLLASSSSTFIGHLIVFCLTTFATRVRFCNLRGLAYLTLKI